MDQGTLINVLQAHGRLAHVVARLLSGQRARLRHPLLQVRPFHVFHREEVCLPAGAGVVRHNDIGMHELADRLNFPIKPAHDLGIVRLVRPDELDGHRPLHVDVPGLVHEADPALTEPFDQDVRPQH